MRLGFFPAFRGSDTVLVSGGKQELLRLTVLLKHLEGAKVPALIWKNLEQVQVYGGLELISHPTGPIDRIDLRRRRNGARVVNWTMSEEGWLEVSEKIEAVALSGEPGHQYFEAPGALVTIMVSKDEYSDAWWEKQF